jgi:hypothetical protein
MQTKIGPGFLAGHASDEIVRENHVIILECGRKLAQAFWLDMLRPHMSDYTDEIVRENHVIILECGRKLAQAFWLDMLRLHLSNYADEIVHDNHVIYIRGH